MFIFERSHDQVNILQPAAILDGRLARFFGQQGLLRLLLKFGRMVKLDEVLFMGADKLEAPEELEVLIRIRDHFCSLKNVNLGGWVIKIGTFVIAVQEDEFGLKTQVESFLADVLVEFVVEKGVRVLLPGHCFHVESGLFGLLGGLHCLFQFYNY